MLPTVSFSTITEVYHIAAYQLQNWIDGRLVVSSDHRFIHCNQNPQTSQSYGHTQHPTPPRHTQPSQTQHGQTSSPPLLHTDISSPLLTSRTTIVLPNHTLTHTTIANTMTECHSFSRHYNFRNLLPSSDLSSSICWWKSSLIKNTNHSLRPRKLLLRSHFF